MNLLGYYESLIEKFPEGKLGEGLEPTFPGLSYQPMTYGLLLSSVSSYYKKFPNKNSVSRIIELIDWLIDNSDLDEDGIPGWGLPHEWDAFQDGSINPANHPYTITTSIVMNGFLDALSSPDLVTRDKKIRIQEILTRVSLQWCHHVWTDNETGDFFWYSPNVADNYFTPNVSAMFLGTLSRLLNEQTKLFNATEYKFIQKRIDSASEAIISNVSLINGYPQWRYSIYNDPSKKTKLNDLVHHGYIIWGMETYRENGGRHELPWTIDQSVASIDSFIVKKSVQRYQNKKGPARLWGVGMALAFFSEYADIQRVTNCIEIINEVYGPFPNLKLSPTKNSKNKLFYPRYAAHVLWGLALSL
jgi:hypothetical protein